MAAKVSFFIMLCQGVGSIFKIPCNAVSVGVYFV